jgi:hypothetical protein
MEHKNHSADNTARDGHFRLSAQQSNSNVDDENDAPITGLVPGQYFAALDLKGLCTCILLILLNKSCWCNKVKTTYGYCYFRFVR